MSDEFVSDISVPLSLWKVASKFVLFRPVGQEAKKKQKKNYKNTK